ncbi:MAG: HAMP domain-containing sensor histidine kinase [Planctomycetota bacterium]
MSEQHSQSTASEPHDAIGGQALDIIGELQAELDSLREQLTHSNRLSQLGMLTAALAHETNNFLTPVRCYAQLALANQDDPATTTRALQSAVQGCQKVAELAERVIGLGAPNGMIQTGVCQAGEVIDSVLESLGPSLKQQRIHAQTELEVIELGIDRLTLEQVLINLISNACQAMAGSSRAKHVRIDAEKGDAYAELFVSDTGPGIPEPIRDVLFKPFTTQSGSGNSIGSGLGLSICRQLVESVGGKIELASTSDQGSRFRIVLPIAA